MIDISFEEEKYNYEKGKLEEFLKRHPIGKISKKRGLFETSNLFRPRRKNKDDVQIELSPFNRVIKIDEIKLVADVGGSTTYEDFVKAVLPYGYMPAVVPELKTITVGGAMTGIGIESSSIREGLVHESIIEMDLLTADGVVKCNNDEYLNLFFGFPNSYGTLGYALRLKVGLSPVKKFVGLNHHSCKNSETFFKDLEKICTDDKVDFIDGTVFSKDEMYVTKGIFIDRVERNRKISDYTGNEIYYKSIRENVTDVMTTSNYLWRWDTDWFWRSDGFGVQNKKFRKIIPKLLLGSKNYQRAMRASHKFPNYLKSKTSEWVIQDVPIPIENCDKFLDFLNEDIGISPIWICPTRPIKENKWPLFPMEAEKLYVNFGFWGKIKSSGDENYYNKLVEDKVEELSGIKSLYSSSFYDKERFYEIFSGKTYEGLKDLYDPKTELNPDRRFGDLYEKVVLRK